jgi:hypothetical protein
MRPLPFIAIFLPLLSFGSSVPAWTAESEDAPMTADTVSKTTAADKLDTGLISGRSAAAVRPAAPVIADGTPAPDSKGWWW